MSETINPSGLPQLKTTGRWVTNPSGDVVILRGVNLVSKRSQTPAKLGFDENNVRLMRGRGISVVRPGFQWCNIEPYFKPDGTKRDYEQEYLNSIKSTIRLLAKHEISPAKRSPSRRSKP
jgi:hypothetical protein